MAAPRARDQQPWVDNVAHAALPAIRQALAEAVNDADLPADILPVEAAAAAAIALADGILADHVAREQAVAAEIARGTVTGGSPSAAHEHLGDQLGLSRQAVEKRLRMTPQTQTPDLPTITALRVALAADLPTPAAG